MCCEKPNENRWKTRMFTEHLLLTNIFRCNTEKLCRGDNNHCEQKMFWLQILIFFFTTQKYYILCNITHLDFSCIHFWNITNFTALFGMAHFKLLHNISHFVRYKSLSSSLSPHNTVYYIVPISSKIYSTYFRI